MNRNNLILLALLLLQGTCIGVRQLGSPDEATTVQRGLLLGELATDGVTGLTIEESGDTEQTKSTLARGPDGWTVSERWDHPADGDKVDELLRELAALEIADVVSSTGLHAVDLGVADADFEKKVTIATQSGDKVLLLGTSGRGSSTHARLGGSDEIVAVRNFSTWRVNARPDGWVDRKVLEIDPATVARLELASPDGTLSFSRSDGEIDGAAAWLMSDGVRSAGIDAEVVDPLLAKASKLSSSKVLGPAAPIAEPLLTVTLTTAGGVTRYSLGLAADENLSLAVDGSTHLLAIGKWAAENLLNAAYDELLPAEAPEAPEDVP